MFHLDDVTRILNSGVEAVAQMSVGQALLRLIDKLLWIVEKSIQWSLPGPEITEEENGKTFGKVELVRPLPWILFLPGLIFLRMIRVSINMTAFVLGYPQVGPVDMIRVVQRGRRRIRAIKSTGLKTMRLKKCTPKKISSLSEEKKTTEDGKRKYSEIITESDSDEDEPLLAKLERLAADSSSDSSFCPADRSLMTESESDSAAEADVSIPIDELEDLKNEIAEAERSVMNSLRREMQSDNELHKANNEAKLPAVKKSSLSLAKELEKMAKTSATNLDVYCTTMNGVGDSERDTAYYSPISWKSVSPDISISLDKQDNQVDGDGKSEELCNGEVTDSTEKEDSDSVKPHVNAAGEEVVNGHVKEKQRMLLQSGGNNIIKQKNKRGNHGNRKKK